MTHLSLDLKSYYQETNPFHHSFLKRAAVAMGLHRYVGGKAIVDRLRFDSVFLHEATAFMSASISNLLAFKKLMCGNYYPWAKTTLYYSNFYSVNCMLRFAGFAIVHIENKETNRIQIERDMKLGGYRINNFGKNEHVRVWTKFAEIFPDILPRHLSAWDREERMKWNYDPFYFSQGTEEYALQEARDFCQNSFIDPEFGDWAGDADQAEYVENLVKDYGFEEGATGDSIRKSIELLTEIGLHSTFRNQYSGILQKISKQTDLFDTNHQTRQTLKSWLDSATDKLSTQTAE
jgi:hypothetical protein